MIAHSHTGTPSGSVLCSTLAAACLATATFPLARIITWSEIAKVCSSSCETKMLVRPMESFSLANQSRGKFPDEMGSMPENGSSYITSSGSSAIARAKATRRAMPPDSVAGHQITRATQADRVEFHQHDVANHRRPTNRCARAAEKPHCQTRSGQQTRRQTETACPCGAVAAYNRIASRLP
jgi:hypothetical protein